MAKKLKTPKATPSTPLKADPIDGIDADEKIKRAKIGLVIKQPFISTILLNLKILEGQSNEMICNSMQTDGKSIKWYRQFVNALTVPQTVYVLAHECWHVALGHPLRRGIRDPRKFNIAGDHVINLMLNDNGLTAPDGDLQGQQDPQYAKKSTEQVYDMLPESEEGQNNMDGLSTGNARPMTESEMAQATQELKQLVLSASCAQKSRGNMPGSWQELCDKYTESTVTWNEFIKGRLMYNSGSGRWDMKRPSRRYVSSGVFLPQVCSVQVGTVLIIRDTSGSVSNQELTWFNGEMKSISEDLHAKVHLIDCDYEMYDRGSAAPNEINWEEYGKVKGRGGTSFIAPFKWLVDNIDEVKPIAIVYFTDMEGDFPKAKLDPGVPVYWVATTGLQYADSPHFGTVLAYEPPKNAVR
jgi:predicted metal-dependent peptidase